MIPIVAVLYAVLATLPSSDAHDCPAVDVMSGGQDSSRLFGCSDGQHVGGRQFGSKVPLADVGPLPNDVFWWDLPARVPPSLRHHVGHVVLVSPLEQVIGVHTEANVASVKDHLPGRYRSAKQLPRKTMRADRNTVDRSRAIPAFQTTTDPHPAASRAVDAFHKAAERDRVSVRERTYGQRVDVVVFASIPAERRAESTSVGRVLQAEIVVAPEACACVWGHD